MTRTLYRLAATLLGGLALAAAAQEAIAPEPAAGWSRWHARLDIGTVDGSPRLGAASLLGDYYFGGLQLGATGTSGGFRATSGLMLGGGTAWLGAAGVPARLGGGPSIGHLGSSSGAGGIDPVDPGATLPYLGLGFTRISSGLSFSADLGWLARYGHAGGASRPVLGEQGLDAVVRQLKLSPVLQLGVRYSF